MSGEMSHFKIVLPDPRRPEECCPSPPVQVLFARRQSTGRRSRQMISLLCLSQRTGVFLVLTDGKVRLMQGYCYDKQMLPGIKNEKLFRPKNVITRKESFWGYSARCRMTSHAAREKEPRRCDRTPPVVLQRAGHRHRPGV